ncbi:MAG: caspase family protein [Anaerolineae bacterium]|nr:caspase family protein [Anaerolineae bacterium]
MTFFQNAYALIIGVGADLPNTVDDANGLATILRDEGRCTYPPSQVHRLTGPQATRDAILAALDILAQSSALHPASCILLYFSGHGYQVSSSVSNAYFLMPYGYDVHRLKQTAISGAEFTAKLRAIPAQKLLVLLDCCHAGGVGDAKAPGLEFVKSPLPPETLDLLAEGKGRVLISSSKEDELSYAGKPYSAFTLALIESLSGAGVAKQDGFVRVADVALHAREVVPGRTGGKQHPILHFEHADNFALAYYAGGDTKPKGLPFDVEPEIEPEPGAWRGISQAGQTVHGPQTNIAGNVTGPVLSGQFDGPVAVGGGEAVDMRGSQGAVHKPSGPVKQHFGERITIAGNGNVIGNNNRVNVNKSQTTGGTIDQFLRLLNELRQAIPQAGLDPDEAASAVADLDVVERQVRKPQPKPAFIMAKLNGILSLLATADGVWERAGSTLTERVRPLAEQIVNWARQLF